MLTICLQSFNEIVGTKWPAIPAGRPPTALSICPRSAGKTDSGKSLEIDQTAFCLLCRAQPQSFRIRQVAETRAARNYF